MSDKDKHTSSDNPDAPLLAPKIDVTVTPVDRPIKERWPDKIKERVARENSANSDAAKKMKKGLEDEVRKVVKESESGGKDKQLDAARKAGERVAEDQPPNRIERIDIDVDGNKSTHVPGVNGPKEPESGK